MLGLPTETANPYAAACHIHDSSRPATDAIAIAVIGIFESNGMPVLERLVSSRMRPASTMDSPDPTTTVVCAEREFTVVTPDAARDPEAYARAVSPNARVPPCRS